MPDDSTRKPKPISRRTFLRLGLLAAIGAGGLALERAYEPVGVLTYWRWMVRGWRTQTLARPAHVALAACPAYDEAAACLADLWRAAGMPDVQGKRVLVKPNLVDSLPDHPATTDPALVAALLDLLAGLGAARVVVGDGPAFRREAAPVAEATGLSAVLARRGIPFVDLNYDDPQPVPLRDDWFLKASEIWLPRHVREADLIVSLPKLKTHHWTTVSLSLKNLFGVVPGVRYGWPKNILHLNGIPASILGLYQSLPPTVAVIDGIVGMEGDGPLFGTSVPHGLLAVGADPVAVDTLCSRLMGIDPQTVDYLRVAAWAGIGQAGRIETSGPTPDSLTRAYQRPPSL